MKKTELLYHICDFYMKHNSLTEDTSDGAKVNKTTAKVYELKNKLFIKYFIINLSIYYLFYILLNYINKLLSN